MARELLRRARTGETQCRSMNTGVNGVDMLRSYWKKRTSGNVTPARSVDHRTRRRSFQRSQRGRRRRLHHLQAARLEHARSHDMNSGGQVYEKIKPRLHRRIGRELRLAHRVLDLGCGSCELVRYLADAYEQQVTGVDISSGSFLRRWPHNHQRLATAGTRTCSLSDGPMTTRSCLNSICPCH